MMPFKNLLIALPIMACFIFSFQVAKKRTRVVFFGDSITEFGVLPGGYIAQLNDSIAALGKAKRYELIGSGIGGNKIYDLYLRLEEDVLERKPDVVVLYVGVNDVWHKQLYGTGTDADKFHKFYTALIQKFQRKGIRVIACTPACIGERHPGENQMDGELDRFSEIIEIWPGRKTSHSVISARPFSSTQQKITPRTAKAESLPPTGCISMKRGIKWWRKYCYHK